MTGMAQRQRLERTYVEFCHLLTTGTYPPVTAISADTMAAQAQRFRAWFAGRGYRVLRQVPPDCGADSAAEIHHTRRLVYIHPSLPPDSELFGLGHEAAHAVIHESTHPLLRTVDRAQKEAVCNAISLLVNVEFGCDLRYRAVRHTLGLPSSSPLLLLDRLRSPIVVAAQSMVYEMTGVLHARAS